MGKRREWYESEELDEYGHPVPPHDGVPVLDRRTLEEKYRQLSAEVVGLRLEVANQAERFASVFHRIQALEEISVLDCFAEASHNGI